MAPGLPSTTNFRQDERCLCMLSVQNLGNSKQITTACQHRQSYSCRSFLTSLLSPDRIQYRTLARRAYELGGTEWRDKAGTTVHYSLWHIQLSSVLFNTSFLSQTTVGKSCSISDGTGTALDQAQLPARLLLFYCSFMPVYETALNASLTQDSSAPKASSLDK